MTNYRGPFLVDGHVHIYEAFDRARFLDGALRNFQAAATRLNIRPSVAGCLMMTEKPIHHVFREFRSEADGEKPPSAAPWRFERTGEPDSLLARRDTGETLLIMAGRQVETRGNLEVLALGCDREFPTGLTLPQALEAVLASPAIAVLPWGFGKWWSKRGRIIAEALAHEGPKRVFLGDNSARPHFYPTPKIFRAAAARGILNLPGTDTLPFASEEARPGRFGFVLDGDLDRDRPAEAIRAHLLNLKDQPRVFGSPETIGRFTRNQVKMQLMKYA